MGEPLDVWDGSASGFEEGSGCIVESALPPSVIVNSQRIQ